MVETAIIVGASAFIGGIFGAMFQKDRTEAKLAGYRYAALRACRENGRLSRRIHKQRLVLKKYGTMVQTYLVDNQTGTNSKPTYTKPNLPQ